MYNSQNKCLDNDLTLLSYNQKINKSFTVNELKDSGLWVVESQGDILKCIPLFNCDSIVSSNNNDIVLEDNKCLICHKNSKTIISCISDDTGSINFHDISLHAYTAYSKLDLIDSLVISCVVYDNYLNTLNNVSVKVIVDGDLVGTVNTDNNGICKYKIEKPCYIFFEYENTVSNPITIEGE